MDSYLTGSRMDNMRARLAASNNQMRQTSMADVPSDITSERDDASEPESHPDSEYASHPDSHSDSHTTSDKISDTSSDTTSNTTTRSRANVGASSAVKTKRTKTPAVAPEAPTAPKEGQLTVSWTSPTSLPRKPKIDKRERVSYTVRESLVEQLKVLAASTGYSQSELVDMALARFLRAEES